METLESPEKSLENNGEKNDPWSDFEMSIKYFYVSSKLILYTLETV